MFLKEVTEMCQMVETKIEIKRETLPVEYFLDYICYIKFRFYVRGFHIPMRLPETNGFIILFIVSLKFLFIK